MDRIISWRRARRIFRNRAKLGPAAILAPVLTLGPIGLITAPAWSQGLCAGQWSAIAGTPNGTANAAVVMPNGDLVVAGSFSAAGGNSANNIARWNGTAWSALGTGLNSNVFALAVMPNGNLVVGGRFTTAGGVVAPYIAKWNGSTWTGLGSGMNGEVLALAVLPNGNLVAAGFFNSAGGVGATNIAMWNGSAWSAIGFDPVGGPTVKALTVMPNGDLIAAGAIFYVGSVITNGIVRWNGVTWSSLGTGMGSPPQTNPQVDALAVLTDGTLVAGGYFTSAGGAPVNWIARWNGVAWSPLGSGLGAPPSTLLSLPNGALLAGGGFTTAGGANANRIAHWGGTTWQPLGAGVGPNNGMSVTAIARLSGGDIVACGDFSQPALFFARWRCNGPARWINASGGNFGTAANWSIGAVPTSGDAIAFDLPGAYTVALDANRSVASAQWVSGDVRIQGTDQVLSVASPITIGTTPQSPVHLTIAGCRISSPGEVRIQPGATVSLRTISGFPFNRTGTLAAGSGVDVRGTLEGNGAVEGNVTNRGTVAPRFAEGSVGTDLAIHGNYITSTEAGFDPTLVVEARGANQPPAGVSSISVDGQIQVGGTLRVEGGVRLSTLSPGTRFSVVNVAAPAARFDASRRFAKQHGLLIDPTRFLFVNHAYLSPHDGASNQSPVQVCVLETPEQFAGSSRTPLLWSNPPQGARGLMLVTHGTSSDMPDGNPAPDNTFGQLAQRAAYFAANHGLGSEWDIATIDWGPYSTHLPGWADWFDPWESARVGQDIAESLSAMLADQGFRYGRYHLLSHSSGVYLVNQFASALVRDQLAPASQISLSLFDAFYPPASTLLTAPLGSGLGYAEQYVDTGALSPWGTNETLPGMLNIDVTNLRDADGPFDSHAWPWVWYIQSITAANTAFPQCGTPTGFWGFARSPLVQDALILPSACYPQPNMDTFGSAPVYLPWGSRQVPPVNWQTGDRQGYEVSSTGTVQIDSNGAVSMTTGSPVWARITYRVSFISEFVRFTYRFTSPAPASGNGLLTVSAGASTLTQTLECMNGTTAIGSGALRLPGRLLPGASQTIEFLLEPQAAGQSSIEITGVEFGLEPCPADFNDDGQVAPSDIALFVNTWLTSLQQATLAGDFDGNGSVEPGDVSLFVSDWFTAVTNGC